jgi:nucleoside-diphosphate-sugar epimerase
MHIAHVAVVGGRGWLGRAIVQAVRWRGLALTVVSRRPGPGVVAMDPDDSKSMARALARADLVINSAGYRGADARLAVTTNFRLPEDLARLAITERWRLVHVGSAAEYGRATPGSTARLGEDDPCAPSTLYGMTKLAGTQAVLRRCEDGADVLVARVFNLAAAQLPADNPLLDFAKQVGRLGSDGEVAIGDPTTVRDFSRRSWAAAAIVALGVMPERFTGLVNVCSGRPTSFGDLVVAMAHHLGVPVSVRDLGWPRGGHIVGDPSRFHSLIDLPALDEADDLVRSILGPASPQWDCKVPVLAGDTR